MSQTPTTYGLPKKREQVIEELNLAYANQNLDDQEYERRLQEATMAKSIEELMLVLFDFPSEIKNRLFPRNPAVVTTQPAPGYAYPTPHPNSKIQVILGTDSRSLPEFSNSLPKISAILSTQKLDFRLSQVSEMSINLYIECILSNTTIDLRNEHLDGKHINIYISGLMGELKIMLPRGVSIQRNIQLIAGEFKVQDKQRSWIKRLTGMGTQDTPPDIQLTVAVYGTFWLGTVRIVY